MSVIPFLMYDCCLPGTSLRGTNTLQPRPRRPTHLIDKCTPPRPNSTQPNLPSSSQTSHTANPDSTIESGPSFSESLNRFKTASGHNAQVASWKSSRQQSSSSSHVQRRVEETRTMITQSSQKSYHIE